jgi:signal transduction histidine kinase
MAPTSPAPVPLRPRRWALWAVVFAVWTLLGLIDAGQMSVVFLLAERPFAWWQVMAVGCADWYMWAALTPLVLWLARRYPFRASVWPRRLLLHTAVSVVLSLLVLTLVVPVVQALWQDPDPPHLIWRRFFLAKFHLYALLYWALLCVSHALAYYRAFRDRSLQAARLEARLARAELEALKMQLDPHFLFNTLHTISALMHRDVELADAMLARLGDLLRQTLHAAGTQEVPLAEELDFVGRYLEIHKARLGSRLEVTLDIDPDTRAARVPNLILQPLVENAVLHGVSARPEGGRVEIRSWRGGGALHLEVCDDGPGLGHQPRGRRREGVGLANTRARLRHLYGKSQRLELRDGAPGLVVRLDLPFRTAVAPQPGADVAPPSEPALR